MPEEVCTDVARELLRRVLCAAGHDKDAVAVVRALKSFRAVNRTFRDAFEEDWLGCTLLVRYMIWVHNCTMKRKHCIDRFQKMRSRAERDQRRSPIARKATTWIFDLQLSLEYDVRNYKRFITTLQYVINGNVLANLAVYHYATLPSHHPEHLSRVHGGLPKGTWKLSPSHDACNFPPRGTIAWTEGLVFADLPVTEDRLRLARKTVGFLFNITKEQDPPMPLQQQQQQDEWAKGLERYFGDLGLDE